MRWAWLAIGGLLAGTSLHELAHWAAARLVGADNVKAVWNLDGGLVGVPAIQHEIGDEPARSYLVYAGPLWKHRAVGAAPLVPALVSSAVLTALRPGSVAALLGGVFFVFAQLPLSKVDRELMWL